MDEQRSIVVRCKPSAGEENVVWKVEGGKTLTFETEEYQVDSVSHNESHEQFYSNHLSRWVRDTACRGHNLTVLAYGLPNSGKTHCTMGTSGQSRMKPEARGVIVRCFEQLLAAGTRGPTRVTASFCHMLDDGNVADLLNTKKRNLQVEETVDGSYSISGCTQQVVTTTSDLVKLLEKANLMRNATGVAQIRPGKQLTIKSPSANIMSMYRPHKSHAIFQYTIEHAFSDSNNTDNTDSTTALVSTLSVIDLAGQSISQFGSDCSDVGLRALNDTLDKLSNGDVENAAKVCRTTALTCLLYSGLFGNSKCLLVSTLSMDSTTDAKTALKLTLGLRNAKNNSTPLQFPLGSTNVGKTILEMKEVQNLLTEKCTGSNTSSLLEVEDAYSVKIDGKVYDDLKEPERELLQKYLDLKSSLLQATEHKETVTQLHIHQQSNQPIVRVLPTKHATPPTLPFLASPLKMPILTPQVLKPPMNQIVNPPVLNPPVSPSAALNPPILRPPVNSPAVLNPPVSPPAALNPPILRPPVNSPAVLNPPMQTVHSSAQQSTHDSKPLLSPQRISDRTLQPMQLPASIQEPASAILSLPKRMSNEGQLKPPIVQIQQPLRGLSLKNKETDSHSWSGSSESEEDRGEVTRQYSRGSSSPPPLHDIPHILPSAVAVTHSSTSHNPSQVLMPPSTATSHQGTHTSEQHSDAGKDAMEGEKKIVKLDRKSITSEGRRALSSSSTSSTGSSPNQTHKKKKKKVKRRSLQDGATSPSKATHTVMELNTHTPKKWRDSYSSSSSSNASDEEDTFDPNFKPGRLTLDRQFVAPHLSHYSSNRHEVPTPTKWLSEGVSVHHGNMLDEPKSFYRSGQPPAIYYPLDQLSQLQQVQPHPQSHIPASFPINQQQVGVSLISEKDIHVAAMSGVKQSYLKQLNVQSVILMIAHKVMKYGVNYTDEGGRTPLMYSVLGNQPKMCEVLISCNADVDAIDHSGNTALLWATIQARAEIIKILLKYGGANICKCDSEGRSVFHWAMRTPNIRCLKILCGYSCMGIENKQDNEQLTPLHWSVMCEQHNHIKLLLKSLPNADVNPEDSKGRTPLNFAVLNFSPICIKALIDSRPSDAVKFSDAMKRTALHYACADGSVDCVRTLLSSQSCDLHATDIKGTTPLHWAAASNQIGIVQLLLRRGADRGQTDNNGMTPLDYANQRNYLECVQIIQSYGLQRPSSAWSIASQFSIHPPTPPEVDQLGHVPLKRPGANRLFSSDRVPGDGQHSTTEVDTTTDQHHQQQQQLSAIAPTLASAADLKRHSTNSDCSQAEIVAGSTVANQNSSDNGQQQQQQNQQAGVSSNWFLRLFQHCVPRGSHSNAVQPAEVMDV